MDRSPGPINLLFVLALVTDLFTPFLIWKGILPAYTRWVSHVAVATMMGGIYARMMVFDRVPGAVWIVAGISAVGVGVALFQGQGVAATAWGWWILFQYPLVGLYAYLQPHWPDQFPQRLRTFCVATLGMQVVIQIVQYLTGQPPGDNLAGMFGEGGTANLVVFILLVLCLALGQWLVHGQWKKLAWVLALGSVSSVLGEMKLFLFAVLALGMVAAVTLTFQRGQLGKLVPYVLLMGAVAAIFFGLYDSVLIPARGTRPLTAYLELRTLANYLGGATQMSGSGSYSGRYYLGRNYALAYGWNAIRRDTMTFLFGLGLGARGESRILGTAGIGLLRGHLGLSTGTSLLVMMQELGLLGMATLGGFILWIVVALFKGIKNYPQSDATELRYALLLFSVLWPLWLWYSSVWVSRVPMLLYWMALGYVLAEPRGRDVDTQWSRIGSLPYSMAATPKNEL